MTRMKWMSENTGEDKILYLKVSNLDVWKPYYVFRFLKQPEHIIPALEGQKEMKTSRGYSTMQYLLKKGWVLEKSV